MTDKPDINDIIDEHGDGGAGYEASAQAAVDETLAAFKDAASRYGLTGFQASWCALRVLQGINHWEGPLIVSRAETMLYPQYEHPVTKVAKWATDSDVQEWLREQAEEKLKKTANSMSGSITASPSWHSGAHNVREHWRKLAGHTDADLARASLNLLAEVLAEDPDWQP